MQGEAAIAEQFSDLNARHTKGNPNCQPKLPDIEMLVIYAWTLTPTQRQTVKTCENEAVKQVGPPAVTPKASAKSSAASSSKTKGKAAHLDAAVSALFR